ncbi:glycosyltransferase family 2 protein [Bacteroides clarus]|uniref:glycosyltransferase family 2 protein n=1 Tax=Bacteroides clarus TaxID=626929 RepID=UPI001897A9B4|nr:glycosyltransferase family 2 protein [Bacteroides clarus]
MRTTLVSVIVPCYNAVPYIIEAIESVISQSYTDWEMLIIDDCSSDNSASIIQNYCAIDNRIKYYKTKESSGSPTLPRNIGIENAMGRYIAFLDSDDVWLPNKLEEQLKLFDKSKAAIAYSNYEKITESGEREQRIIKAPAEVSYKQLLLGNVIGCLTAIYDTDKTGKVYFSEHAHEDYIMWLSILKRGYIAKNTNTVTALYRVRNRSVSSNKLKAIFWQWSIYVNVEKTGYLKAVYYFVNYAYRAFLKILK